MSFDLCPTDIKLLILNLCEARALGVFSQMNKTFNRVLSKSDAIWRAAFVREISSDSLDLKFFNELVEEKNNNVASAFAVMYQAMSDRMFRSRTSCCCVAIIGDASARMMSFALEGFHFIFSLFVFIYKETKQRCNSRACFRASSLACEPIS
jgi:hypothetical protein